MVNYMETQLITLCYNESLLLFEPIHIVGMNIITPLRKDN